MIGGPSTEPYNNLAVPIATVGDLLSISGLDSTNHRFYDEILGRHGKAVDQMLAGGVIVGGARFDLRFLFGGLIGLDGVNPTPLGNVFVANAFIDTINDAWGAELPRVAIGRDFNPSNPRGRN